MGACPEVRAVPSVELGCSWCHLWLWCHLWQRCHPQIHPLSWGQGMESQGWVPHVQKGAPLAWCSLWMFVLPGMELCQPKGCSSPGAWTLLGTVGLPQPPQWQHLPPVLPGLCTSGTSGAQEWPPGLSLQLPRAEHGAGKGFRLSLLSLTRRSGRCCGSLRVLRGRILLGLATAGSFSLGCALIWGLPSPPGCDGDAVVV